MPTDRVAPVQHGDELVDPARLIRPGAAHVGTAAESERACPLHWPRRRRGASPRRSRPSATTPPTSGRAAGGAARRSCATAADHAPCLLGVTRHNDDRRARLQGDPGAGQQCDECVQREPVDDAAQHESSEGSRRLVPPIPRSPRRVRPCGPARVPPAPPLPCGSTPHAATPAFSRASRRCPSPQSAWSTSPPGEPRRRRPRRARPNAPAPAPGRARPLPRSDGPRAPGAPRGCAPGPTGSERPRPPAPWPAPAPSGLPPSLPPGPARRGARAGAGQPAFWAMRCFHVLAPRPAGPGSAASISLDRSEAPGE